MKRLVRPGLGFGSLPTARRTLAGYEAMAMINSSSTMRIRMRATGLGAERSHRTVRIYMAQQRPAYAEVSETV